MHLKASRHLLKMKVEEGSKLYELIVVVNIAQKSLKFFVISRGFEGNSLLHIHPSKTVYPREKIEPFSTWSEAC